MNKEPYTRFQGEQLILRDFLAADRTVLANERTLLSYTRTALAFAIAGGSIIHFLGTVVADVFGGLLIAVAVMVMAVGLWRYQWFRRRLGQLARK